MTGSAPNSAARVQTRDFIHVYDVAETILNSSTKKAAEGQIFNLGSGKPTTIHDLAHTILEMCGKSDNIVYSPPRPDDIKHSYADISKVQQLLDCTPKYLLKEGLQTLKDEFRKYQGKQGHYFNDNQDRIVNIITSS